MEYHKYRDFILADFPWVNNFFDVSLYHNHLEEEEKEEED